MIVGKHRIVAVDADHEGRAWFVAQIKPNQLAVAERNLMRQGFTVFCPKERQTIRRANGFSDRLTPLFMGYVFVGVDKNSSPVQAIGNTYGVARLIRTTRNVPAQVPSSFIRMLALRCNQDGVLMNENNIQPGDLVRIVRGPFVDFVAKIEKIDARQRIWILLELMGCKARISLDMSDVKLCA